MRRIVFGNGCQDLVGVTRMIGVRGRLRMLGGPAADHAERKLCCQALPARCQPLFVEMLRRTSEGGEVLA
jgi:cell fate regulator YaaT (PSP1 superfamily)